jgi:hypothetical protein
VPPNQAREARRILREHGEMQYIVDMEAFRGIGGGTNLTKVGLWVAGAAVVLVAILFATSQL